MKDQYENRSKTYLPRRTYAIIRIDGKAFHTYTKGCDSPFDKYLIEAMDETACKLCKEIQGAKFGYVQSDEISILVTDFDKINTNAWFDGSIQKICSVSASLATGFFNDVRLHRFMNGELSCFTNGFRIANFDSRVFSIPDRTEVENYFIWRNQDCIRNSISMVAQSLYSSKQLHGKNTTVQKEMIAEKGKDWNDFKGNEKFGRLIIKETYKKEDSDRTRWVSVDASKFSDDRHIISSLIPFYESELQTA